MTYTDPTMTALEGVKKTTKNGGEYWMARDIQGILGYAAWEYFYSGAIKRGIESCRSGGIDPNEHFRDTTKVMEVGNGAMVPVADCYLDRYACYLVAMNGDASKAEIAAAQRYFAVQARLQENDKQQLENAERVRLRDRVTEATKHLNSAAKAAGVQNYAFFANAGYQGLYKMGLAEIKKKKGIPEKEQLFDRAGRLELAANEFRAPVNPVR